MKWLIVLIFGCGSAQAQIDSFPQPTYKGETLVLSINDTTYACDSTDTIGNTIYCWQYTQNRWFARVYVYYGNDFQHLSQKYLAHMALGHDRQWTPIFLGPIYSYRRNGLPESVITYEEGVKHGPARYYDRRGTLRQAGTYQREARVHTWQYFNKKGELRAEVFYKVPPERIDLQPFNSIQPLDDEQQPLPTN